MLLQRMRAFLKRGTSRICRTPGKGSGFVLGSSKRDARVEIAGDASWSSPGIDTQRSNCKIEVPTHSLLSVSLGLRI